MEENTPRLIIASNRLPITLKQIGNQWETEAATGGLATAFHTILGQHGGAWLGWLGSSLIPPKEILQQVSQELGYEVFPVPLTDKQVQGYYDGFSNQILWPLFHSFETRCHFDPKYWNHYCEANEEFAQVLAENTTENDILWVQDYHLMRVASCLKKQKIFRKTGFFLHIPFPPPDIFLKLPWRAEILQGLLDFDIVGVQTPNDCRNLLDTLRRIQPSYLEIEGEGAVKRVTLRDRHVKIGAFPISIDFAAFASEAAQKKVAEKSWYFHEDYANRKIILGVDRCDYTKGVPQRIEAFHYALEHYPELREKVTYVQLLVPSREDVPEYEKIKKEVDHLISRTNSRFGVPGWVPIHYFYRKLPREELLAYYRATDIAYVTPLRDGMNLVSKEYCACQIEENGVLILSEFAGSAAELNEYALLINPYDTRGTAEALYRAYTMPKEERKTRMHRLREIIRAHDIDHWLQSYYEAVFAEKYHLPATVVSDYTPSVDVDS